MDWLTWARDFFANDKFATEATGITIEQAEPGRAVCSLKIEDRHKNAYGSVMGGAIFTLADLAIAIVVNLNRPSTVSSNATISYLAAPKGNTLTAEAKLIRAGRRSCFAVVEVFDGEDRQIAYCTGTGFVVDS